MHRFDFNTRAQRARRLLGIPLGRPTAGPQVVSLEITHHCNLRCSFCESHGSYQAQPITARRTYAGGRVTMDLETIRRLAGDLARLNTDLVELSGKGDPIAHPHLSEVVRIIKGEGLSCALVTNATLARPDLARTLVERRLDRLSVSLNAGCREVYAKANGRDLWEKAIAFLEEVLSLRRETGGRRPWVRVSHVVFKDNVDDMDNMVRVCTDLRVDEVNWYVMSELPETGDLQLDAPQVARLRSRIPEWGRRLEAAGVAHDFAAFDAHLTARLRDGARGENPLQRRIPCYEPWMFVVIQPDGEVVPCCYCEEERLGNIVERGFEEIWFGYVYQELRKRALEMPKTGRWICPECFTTCNKALVNLRVYNRIHPLARIAPDRAAGAPEVATETP